MKTTFSVNMYDSDGDIFEECILLHINETTILQLKDIKELKEFNVQISACIKEIEENYN